MHRWHLRVMFLKIKWFWWQEQQQYLNFFYLFETLLSDLVCSPSHICIYVPAARERDNNAGAPCNEPIYSQKGDYVPPRNDARPTNYR